MGVFQTCRRAKWPNPNRRKWIPFKPALTQHVVLMHFPIALYLAAVCFDAFGRWLRKPTWVEVVYYNLSLAALFTLLAAATGIIAWQWQLEGHRLKGILLYHLLSALAASVFIWPGWWLHFRQRRGQTAGAVGLLVTVEALGTAFIVLAGHLGGFLSGVNS
jgi:uncharacterized membrane protein